MLSLIRKVAGLADNDMPLQPQDGASTEGVNAIREAV
jgi:hypothetical protein